VTIKVFQGEREMAADNKALGQFDLVGLPSAPRGVPQIEVTFDIDANGIVSVQAKDKATGKEQQIRIQASGGLSDSDIEKMVKEAEANAEADKARRAFIEAKNHADGLIHQTEKTLTENEGKISAEDKSAAEAAIGQARVAMEGSELGPLTAATEALTQVAMKIGEAVYKAGAEAAAPDAKADGKPGEKVVDADFEEVDHTRKSA
jgi:molecular chaperone DnaK